MGTKIYIGNIEKWASLVIDCRSNFVGYVVCITCRFGLALTLTIA